MVAQTARLERMYWVLLRTAGLCSAPAGSCGDHVTDSLRHSESIMAGPGVTSQRHAATSVESSGTVKQTCANRGAQQLRAATSALSDNTAERVPGWETPVRTFLLDVRSRLQSFRACRGLFRNQLFGRMGDVATLSVQIESTDH